MEPLALIEKYSSKGALIDSNLLLLIAVGIYNRTRIASFKRTTQYTVRDFVLIIGLFDNFRRRVTTPHIITEVSNLARQLSEAEHKAVSAVLKFLIENTLEIYAPSVTLTENGLFPSLGITDCAILQASEGVLVLTDDFRLSNVLSSLGRDVININHIRHF
jgi:hypothetical protein